MDNVEIIARDGGSLCYIIRSGIHPEETTFVTPPEFKQQVGFVVYRRGGEVARHIHKPPERQLAGTSEVLVLRSGSCLIDVFDDDREWVATRELRTGGVGAGATHGQVAGRRVEQA